MITTSGGVVEAPIVINARSAFILAVRLSGVVGKYLLVGALVSGEASTKIVSISNDLITI
jgi:hypothetical protein